MIMVLPLFKFSLKYSDSFLGGGGGGWRRLPIHPPNYFHANYVSKLLV